MDQQAQPVLLGLDTARRWCLSGTPLQNKIHDLYSYLRFFQHKPYEIYEHFYNEIVCHSEMNKKKAYTEVRRVLKDIPLRRTKTTFINGEPILNLPPRIVDLEEVDFYPEEKDFYKKLEKDLEERLLEFVSKQRMVSQFLKWMVELLRLRQACDHPSLVTRCKTKENSLKAPPTQALCDACHDAVRELAVLSCSHACCKDCVGGDVCPVCDKIVVGEDHLEVHSHKMKREEPDRSEWVSSSKIDAAIRKLQGMPVGEKALVFSQLCGMLDVLEIPLKKLGVCYRRLDGTMSVAARDSAVQDFKSDPQVRVIIMSLKAASLGLNMVAASHVLLLDVWWNPTVEDQAIDRAHRIGQTRPVRVTRFVMKESVEGRVLNIQQKKKEMVNLALGRGEIASVEDNGLTEQDLRYLMNLATPQSST